MIRLGLRLAVSGGREAIGRLALISIAVAVGSTLLMITFATLNAFEAQNDRYSWLVTGNVDDPPPSDGHPHDPLYWKLHIDYFRGERIVRVDLAATGPDSPITPGIASLPGPGEYYASPQLAKLLGSTPAPQLADRFPGVLIGTIGSVALPSPGALIVVIGHSPTELADDALLVQGISTTSPSECPGGCNPFLGTEAEGTTLVLSVVAAALLFPVMIFVGGATRLAAARREQRFAAMRLIGATPRQISRLAVVESSVATMAGVVGAFTLFAAIRPLIARVPFSGERFFTGDVALTMANSMLIAVGVPLAAAVAARIALRRVNISPLGVSRRATPEAPRIRRVVPLLGGVVWLVYLATLSDIGASDNSDRQALSYLAGVFMVMIGLVRAGPWLTLVAARIAARRATHAPTLIAARRLGDDPHGSFRAISGVVLAVFVASCSIGIITTIVAYNQGSAGNLADSTGTLVHQQFSIRRDSDDPPVDPSATIRELTSIPGVHNVTLVRILPGASNLRSGTPFVASCAELANSSSLGRCPQGAAAVAIDVDLGGAVVETGTSMADTVWPPVDLSPAELAQLDLGPIVVDTDGTTAAVEQARTVIERLVPTNFAPQTLSEIKARSTEEIDRLRQLANVVMLASLPIAGCSLAVAVAGGLADRRRPFSLLRLTGVPLSMLRRVIGLEAAVPLLIGVVVAAGAGLGTAALFLRAQLDQTLQAPTLQYYGLIIAGVVVSLAVVASTLPLLARTTGPEAARND